MDDETLRAEIAACRESHRRVHERVADVDDAALRGPSRLPGWTVGHVLAHLARNADSVVRRLEGARAGELVEQYAGGAAARAAEIEAGAARPARDVVTDLVRADDAADRAFGTADDGVWVSTVRLGGGATGPARDLVFRRWREVEAHHVDLGLGYEWTDWPDELVERWLPSLLAALPQRAGGHALVAWTTGRGPAPTLPPWG
ncbi:maleylpyruvate isomerase N-terminal domain-containing protein [Blastococcus goldschmidtiae]|uniref:Maleylpyruvate isomerase family mycothiol-dependent enzyme n=1 Tax=Blastococcus goldschmidtiae TaxID=3075546 RepID=A0ABU2KDJ4_9ACTN|nr:maleylpyruvate isomerase N-terminal domain-containing protein [Blastococcus sp. DSM 46792]MDT0278260.1 maleylpyruvate isomerase family mycothiol-dependent enzyme [Blastococcus sp. DSM 46792]